MLGAESLLVYRKRNRKGEKNGKGLRHFSMKVCEKVQRKGTTSYNEVADELVAEFSSADNHILPNESVSVAQGHRGIVQGSVLQMPSTPLSVAHSCDCPWPQPSSPLLPCPMAAP